MVWINLFNYYSFEHYSFGAIIISSFTLQEVILLMSIDYCLYLKLYKVISYYIVIYGRENLFNIKGLAWLEFLSNVLHPFGRLPFFKYVILKTHRHAQIHTHVWDTTYPQDKLVQIN